MLKAILLKYIDNYIFYGIIPYKSIFGLKFIWMKIYMNAQYHWQSIYI